MERTADTTLNDVRCIMIAGGAGFMGSNFTRYMLQRYPTYSIVVFDKLTYAGNTDNLDDVSEDPRYVFVRGDICDADAVHTAIVTHGVDTIINFAAETHVDRSILDPAVFVQTNVVGTCMLLECARRHSLRRFHQISTDEVYGQVLTDRPSGEADALDPRSPYAATKASADLLVMSYFTTFGLPVTITRGSNNIGPFQYPEKVVPLFTTNAIDSLPLPVYGNGLQRREYQYVWDHCEAVDIVLHHGTAGEIYNVGTGQPTTNLEMTELILDTLGKPRHLIQHVQDRPGHDQCYQLNISKMGQLGWRPTHSPQEAIKKTVQWYVDNESWWRKAKGGNFVQYYNNQYSHCRLLHE